MSWGGSNTLLREVPGTRALSITPWIPLAGIPASSSKDFSASAVGVALASTPGKVEIAPSLGHRACFMHCMSVIIMAQLERWPSSARTSINAWSMRMHWSSTLAFFLLLFSPITLMTGGCRLGGGGGGGGQNSGQSHSPISAAQSST